MLRRSLCCRGEVPPVAPYDAIVSGGGLVGASMMRSLQLLRQQLKPNLGGVAAPSSSSSSSLSPGVAPLHRLMLVDAAGRPRFNAENSLHKLRTVSITPVSSKILENLGAWPRLANKHPYYRIAVRHEQINSPFLATEERSTSFFMSALFGSSNTATPVLEFSDLRQPVGFVCYNTELQSVMLDAVEEQAAADALSHCGHDDLCFSSQLSHLQLPADDVVDGPLGRCSMKMQEREEATSFRLLVGCEGRGSIMRDQLSSPMIHHDYAQTAYVCDVQLEKLEDGNVCAYQNFFRDGMIIAMLPTSADSANIVFSTTPKHAKELMAMKTSELMEELNARLHAFAPADIPKIIRVADASSSTPSSGAAAPGRSQGCFPLRLQLATSPYTSRAVLLGDSAHGIHPFAGQGLNLGIYDVCSFTTVLHKAIASGHDIGNRVAVGQAFSGEMASHVLPMVASMEMIKASTRFFPGLSCLGMKAIDRLPLLSTLGKDAILQLSSGSTVAARNKGSFLLQ